ncbi:cytochrome d ubiquinol oxidase subunit I [Rhodoblastus acidophilus]|uniref:cytochrome ubiquinol oxidase subunit I n=1 Tax=Rhodoblastus acidophilus TaxID=1074 RepID=UPI002224D295|nr:cytochrome ubiquinol oxidase subunit I [Rhodoblastus acidophilus]MCW2282730.1 cytochrome d ubiquinol oxidase subunit I [Rhodoblastus acidophilus]MCW2331591.1 cytochrome d ubiquinol oxidase subunit I [Rhodoblastus acidophilus]
MTTTALELARLQFAFTVAFHIVFPALSIGLASYLAVLDGLWNLTKRTVYLDLFNYWKKIFAIGFGMGVVSGLVMSYQFGTNWSVFSDKTGPVLGPLMGYEVLTAFFLEAGFLGVMLFGEGRVSPKLRLFASCMVALGTAISAFWIVAVNSWMQTPQGHALNAAGQFVPQDWLKIVFTPSFPYRFVHMVLAAYLTTAFAVGGVAALHLLRGRATPQVKTMFSMALWMAALVAPVQILAGDMHGLNTLEHQPAKVAAMEGHFDSQDGAPLILFGWPDMAKEKVEYEIAIPHLGAVILTHSWNGRLRGLKEWPRDQWPPVPLPFLSFRIMVALGFAMAGFGLWSLVARWRGRLYDNRLLHRAALALGPSGFVAIVAGWTTTETGRQPYTVYGLLTTAQSASPVQASAVGASLIAFVLVYFALFGMGLYYMGKLMNRPPLPHEPSLPPAPAHATGLTPAAGLIVEGADREARP